MLDIPLAHCALHRIHRNMLVSIQVAPLFTQTLDTAHEPPCPGRSSWTFFNERAASPANSQATLRYSVPASPANSQATLQYSVPASPANSQATLRYSVPASPAESLQYLGRRAADSFESKQPSTSESPSRRVRRRISDAEFFSASAAAQRRQEPYH